MPIYPLIFHTNPPICSSFEKREIGTLRIQDCLLTLKYFFLSKKSPFTFHHGHEVLRVISPDNLEEFRISSNHVFETSVHVFCRVLKSK